MSTPLYPSADLSLKKVSASRISTPSLIRPLLLLRLLRFWSTPSAVYGTREYWMFSVAGMGDDDWDLSAVVRSCRPSSAEAERKSPWLFLPPSGPLMTVEGGKGGAFMRLSEVFESPKGDREMEELYKPFFLEAQSLRQESGFWPPSCSSAEAAPPITMAGSEQPRRRRKVDLPVSQTHRSRRRKNQQKKVVHHVAAEGLSSDLWSWRKYGQKPIKGSPYPRGYYRCSSSKGCPARKLVERNRTDPTVFILTYTAEHNHPMPTHRNTLAGSTRNRFPNPPSGNPEASPLSTTSGPELSPTTPLSATDLSMPKQGEDLVDEDAEVEEDDDEVELLVDDIEVMGKDDLLFVSSEEGGAASAVAELTPLLVDESSLEDDLFHLEWLSHCNNSAEKRIQEHVI